MTRTERNLSPAALLKDRSLSRSGYDKHIHKNGAGGHNWGSYVDEAKMMKGGEDDVEQEEEDDDDEEDVGDVVVVKKQDTASPKALDNNGHGESSSSATMAGAATIAPSKPGPPRRASSGMTQEERDQAKQWRHGVMHREVDLTAIARTSGAVSHSPILPTSELPGMTNGSSLLGTSPINNNNNGKTSFSHMA